MSDFIDTIAKGVTRQTILNRALKLRADSCFVYLGLPGERCLDITSWKSNIKYAYCCEMNKRKYQEMFKKLELEIPGRHNAINGNVWKRMRSPFNHFIDVCNLDFYGGPSSAAIPEIRETASLRQFMINQREHSDGEFLLAWTLGVRNENIDYYRQSTTDYLREIACVGPNEEKEINKWFKNAHRKMIRAYMCYVPCLTFTCAEDARYLVSHLWSIVYKKTMYFSLFRLYPTEMKVGSNERRSFFKEVFSRPILIYDNNNKYVDLEKFPMAQIVKRESKNEE